VLPHASCPPQPSEIVPQLLPCASQVVFVQQVWLDMQTCVTASQVPQLMSGSPQPAGEVPHAQPAGQVVFGTQTPQTFAVPAPPHDSPAPVHAPQCSVAPQPSLKSPQLPGKQIFGAQHFSA